MADYDHRCSTHGVFTVRVPMAESSSTVLCPTCREPARRVFTSPQLRFGDTTARRLIGATEQSAVEPALVSAPFGARLHRGRARAADPRTARLPRP